MPLPTDKAVIDTADNLVKVMGANAGDFPRQRPGTSYTHGPPRPRPPYHRHIHPHSHRLAPLHSPPLPPPLHPIIIRFSNSTGLPTIADNNPSANPHGIGIRFLLSTDHHTHTDIIAHSTPFFPTRTGDEFLSLLHALGAGRIGDHLAEHPAAKAFVEAPKPSPQSFATEKFYSVQAFKFVSADGEERFFRYRVSPVEGYKTLSEEEVKGKSETYLFDDLKQRLDSGEKVEFNLVAQMAGEGDVTDDSTVHWAEDREVVELGTLTVDTYVPDEKSLQEQKRIIFDPIPRVEGVEASKDPLLEMRAAVYLISGKERRAT